jgi:hypothetical protein
MDFLFHPYRMLASAATNRATKRALGIPVFRQLCSVSSVVHFIIIIVRLGFERTSKNVQIAIFNAECGARDKSFVTNCLS